MVALAPGLGSRLPGAGMEEAALGPHLPRLCPLRCLLDAPLLSGLPTPREPCGGIAPLDGLQWVVGWGLHLRPFSATGATFWVPVPQRREGPACLGAW